MAEASGAPPSGPAPLDRGRLAWLAFGIVALAGGTMLGWNPGLLDAVVSPPALIRAALVGASAVGGLALLFRALRDLEAGRGLHSAELGARELATLVRGARYVFLAVAAFSAGAGWLLGHPLPFIVALVIAGVDVLETSFLLLVVTLRREV
jgi:hypothetical protein